MGFNFGSFAGGAADGYSKGLDDQRKQSEEKRKQDEADRETAYQKEIEGIVSPADAHKIKLAEYEQSKKNAEINTSAAGTAAKVVANPAAMGLDWGSFGAAARGENVGDFQRNRAETKLKQDEADRDAAHRKEIESIASPDDVHKAKLAEYEKNRKQTESETSAAGTAARVVANPVVAQGITMPPRSLSPASFSESMEQRSEGIPLAPSRPDSSTRSIIAANGIDAASAMRQEIAKPEPQKAPPEAPAAPGFRDAIDFITQRAAIDMKYGKLDGAGMMKLIQLKKTFDDEGVKGALLKFQDGDIEGGVNEFNQSGSRRMKVIESKRVEMEIGGVKMPTTIAVIEDEKGNRQTINSAQSLYSMMGMEKQLNATMEMMKSQQNSKHQNETTAETARHNRADETNNRIKADAEAVKAKNGDVTFSQQRTNYEIESARKHISGLSPEEINKRTQQYSATGRENPNFDPTLAAKVRQANHRKYGNDDVFDANADNQTTETQPDITSRFSADPVMKGQRLGNKTPQGVEVLDANGKLIGHYN